MAEPGRGRRDRVVPEQHGAWGFLVLPVLLGVAAGQHAWVQLLVGAAWVAAYPLSWAVTGRLTARGRRARFDRALLVWVLTATPLLVAAVLLRPWLLWVGLALSLPFAANLGFARARRERSLANDLVLVGECAVVVPVVAAVPGTSGWSVPWAAMTTGSVAVAVLMATLTLVGSTLHVKSLIRERSDPRYRRAAQVVAAASVPVVVVGALAAGVTPLVAAPFVLLVPRTVAPGLRSWRPARLGLLELAGFVAVAVTALLTL